MASYIFPSQSNSSELRRFMLAATGVLAFMVVFFNQCRIYDLSTAAFFAFGLGMIARGKWDQYFALLAFASVNRETSILLVLVFAVYTLGRTGWKGWAMSVGYQVFLFAAIRLCLMVMFSDNGGVAMIVRPIENLQLFAEAPFGSVVHWAAFAGIIGLFARRWRSLPRIVKVSFAVMMPALTAMYLVLGWAFEVRVFAELFPVVWIQVFRSQWR